MEQSDQAWRLWVNSAGNRVWIVISQSSGAANAIQSVDGGHEWRPLIPDRSPPLRLKAFGDLVWTLRESTTTASSPANLDTSLEILSANGWKRTIALPSRSVDAWVSGDSIWAVSPDGHVWFTQDQGGRWQRRKVPSTGYELSEINASARGIVVNARSGEDVTDFVSSDAGVSWQSFDSEELDQLVDSPSDTLLWAGNGVWLPYRIHPRITRFKPDQRLTRIRVNFELDTMRMRRANLDSVEFEIAGVNGHGYSRGEYDTFPKACSRRGMTLSWSCSVVPAEAGIRPGEAVSLRVTMIEGRFRHAYTLPTFTYHPLWRRVPAPILGGVAAYLMLLITAGLLCWLQPLWLHTVYWYLHRHASNIPWVAGDLATFFLAAVLPYFAHHQRVLNAWVDKHADKVSRALRSDHRLTPPEQYVPLPIAAFDRSLQSVQLTETERIAEPTAVHFRPRIEANRTLIEIIGAGGSGKTTLAVRLAFWGLGSPESDSVAPQNDLGLKRRLAAHRMLPVWVDEEMGSDAQRDLLAVCTRQLAAWTGEEIHQAFTRSLLTKGRLLVVIDRFSERSKETREYLQHVHGRLRVQRMIVTSREPTRFEARVTTRLVTLDLTFESLARMIAARLAFMDPADGLSGAADLREKDESVTCDVTEQGLVPDPYWTPERQAQLAARITRIFRVESSGDKHSTMPLQPLLVRLAVDEAVALRRAGASPGALAASVPRLVENYLVSLNPADADNGLTHAAMLRAAQLAALVELDRNFRPRAFSREEARRMFRQEGWNVESGPDPLDWLVRNGVMKNEGGSYFRFQLDPIAEYVAADATVQTTAYDAQAWREVLEKVEASGASSYRTLLVAFRQIRSVTPYL
jgi:hypothetical protein